MKLARRLGDAVLTVVAAIGLACALLWGATTAGWVQPLVVLSGSMAPAISTGDLLVAVRAPVAGLEVGEVVTLESAATGGLVTHRVTQVTRTGEDSAQVRLRGDANSSEDAELYEIEGSVWQSAVRLPGGGFLVERLARPGVAIPLLVALAAIVGIVLVPSRTEDDDDGRPGSMPRGRHADPARPVDAPPPALLAAVREGALPR